MADNLIPYNALPHIDELTTRGILSVDKSLPELDETMWTLKHKHFDLGQQEVILYEVLPDSMTTRVIKRGEGAGTYPCQAIFVNGEWVVVGVTHTNCRLTFPEIQGSGMITAVLKKGSWMESTDESRRVQVFCRMKEGEEAKTVLTAFTSGASSTCVIHCPLRFKHHSKSPEQTEN